VTQLHLVAESCTICISSSRRPVRKLLVTPSYVALHYTSTFPGTQFVTCLQLRGLLHRGHQVDRISCEFVFFFVFLTKMTKNRNFTLKNFRDGMALVSLPPQIAIAAILEL